MGRRLSLGQNDPREELDVSHTVGRRSGGGLEGV
jgi:hypothetical protein